MTTKLDIELEATFAAQLTPSNQHESRRQDRLSQDARDLLAYGFSVGITVMGFPMTAVEIRIGADDVGTILHGGDNFAKHAGSDSLRYFTHADSEDWALVFAHDCDGDPNRGKAILQRYHGTRPEPKP